MKIDIEIVRDTLNKVYEARYRGYVLFDFTLRNRGDAGLTWMFWLTDNHSPVKFQGRKFPVEYFTNACIAKYYTNHVIGWVRLKSGTPDCSDEMPDGINIVRGEHFIQP